MFDTNEYEIGNALVQSVSLSNADHGCLSSFVHLEMEGTGQGFGGYALANESSPGMAGIWIWRVMEICGVTEWKHCTGKIVRFARNKKTGYIDAIGHAIKDDWFCPREEFAKHHQPKDN